MAWKKRGPLSAAHKAAISAGLRRHYGAKGKPLNRPAKANKLSRQLKASAKARQQRTEAVGSYFKSANYAKYIAKGKSRESTQRRRAKEKAGYMAAIASGRVTRSQVAAGIRAERGARQAGIQIGVNELKRKGAYVGATRQKKLNIRRIR